jgi:hypothetical protein
MFRKLGRNLSQRKASARLSAACGREVEALEGRLMMAAHILGSSTVYSTIQAAVNAAPAGATVTVDAGSYAEMVTVSKSLTIDGAQAGVDARTNVRAANDTAGMQSVITGATSSSGVSTAFHITASDVTIDGFTVQGQTSNTNLGAGIVMAPSIHGTHIINDIIQNNHSGLFLSNNSNTDAVVIQHDVFLNNNGAGTNSNRGIYSDGGVTGGLLTNVLIDSNSFVDNKLASGGSWYEGCISLEAQAVGTQQNITITNNTMDGTGKLLLFNCDNVVIEHNVMTHSMDQWSGTFRFEGGDNNVTVEYNTVYDNTGPGLTVDSKGYPTSDSGFVVEYNNFYNNNTAYGNKYSLAVTAGAYNGTFIAANNYWGSATGPSGQGTGSGDMAWGNGNYEGGANSSWGTGFGSELTLAPYSSTPIGSLDTPYWGIASSAGAPIQAEDYDQGGNGNGYHTTATSNAGGAYRTYEKVGIQATTDTGGGYNVGYTVAGEWLDYTVNVAQGGTYSIQFRVASAQTTGGKFHLNIDGVNVTGSITAPNTGATQTYQTVTINNVNIAAGQHTLRLVMDSVGTGSYVANFNWIKLVPVSVSAPPAAPTSVTAVASSATSVTLNWQESSTMQSGFVIQRGTDGVNFTQVGAAVATATSFNDTTAAPGTSYTYRIYAISSVGNSAYSSNATATTPAIASAPVNLTAVAISPTQVNLTWADTAAGIETGFIIQRAVGASTSFSQVGTSATGVTTFSDTSALAGTTYIYRVLATSAGGNSAASATASATTPPDGAISTYLSTLNWVSATAGWNTVQKNLSISGNPLTLNGVTYAFGLGTHAVSNIVYNLAGGYTNFLSDIGIDGEEKNNGGAVDFQVIGDGTVLYDSGVLTNHSATVTINVAVAGVQTLTLSAINGVAGSIDYDHADWAGARLLSSPSQPPAAPSGLAAVTSSAGQINLSWTNNAPTASAFFIERAPAGTSNYAQIGATGAGVTTFFDTTAAAGTSYNYEVIATNGSANSAASNVAVGATLDASAVVTNVNSLAWVSATAGWNTVQLDTTISGNPITLRGVVYPSGIGTHAVSDIVYNLAGGYANFLSDVGVDDEEIGKGIGSVDFQVIGDGKVLYDSGVLTNSSSIVSMNVNVTGVQTLTLQATNGVVDSIDYDHADWAGARFVSAGGTQTATQSEGTRPASTISALNIVDTAAPSIPTGWSNVSIGNIGQLGSANDAAGVFTTTGAGAGIGGTADALDYVYQSLNGNGTIITRLDTTQVGSDEAGLMIRETSGASAKQAALVLTAKAVKLLHRGKTGGVTASVSTKVPRVVPEFLKLVRKGNTFSAFDSVDGTHWKKVGSTTIKMNAQVEIGLAVASGVATSLNTSVFSDVSISG